MNCKKCGSHRCKGIKGKYAICAGCGAKVQVKFLKNALNVFTRMDTKRIGVLSSTKDGSGIYKGWLGNNLFRTDLILDDFKNVLGYAAAWDALVPEEALKHYDVILPDSENEQSRKQYEEFNRSSPQN